MFKPFLCNNLSRSKFLIFPLVLTIAGCGGGSDTQSPTTPVPQVLPKIINGELTRYNQNSGDGVVAGYSVSLAGISLSRSSTPELQVGMVLNLTTDGNNKVLSVVYDDIIRAPVTAVDTAKKSLTVAGMTILTENARWGNDLTFDTATTGTLVEVSGFLIDSTTIQATYIEREIDESELAEIQGVVTALDSTAETFKLGSIIVDYSSAYAPGMANGLWVEVEGDINGTTMTAQMIDIDTPDYDDLTTMELEGRVSWISTNLDRLQLNHNRFVTLTASTRFRNLANAAAIKTGMLLEIDGTWDSATNSLAAQQVEFDHDDDYFGPTGPSTGPGLVSPEFNLEGEAFYDSATDTIKVNGFSFTPTPMMENELYAPYQNLNGDRVSVSGLTQNDQNLLLEIEREMFDGTIELKGKVVLSETGQNSVWGYTATDGSLPQQPGSYVDVECRLAPAGLTVSLCHYDD